jgi:hypothetical protein
MAAADKVCDVAIMFVEGIIKVSVHYDIPYFPPAKVLVRTYHPTTSCLLPSSLQFLSVLPSLV